MSMKKAKLSCETTVTIETFGFDITTDRYMFMVFCRYEGYIEEHYHETLLPPQSRGEVSDVYVHTCLFGTLFDEHEESKTLL